VPSSFVHEAVEVLVEAGYERRHIATDCTFTTRTGSGELSTSTVDLVAFAQVPHDMRNACIAAFDAKGDNSQILDSLRYLTAPLAIIADVTKVEFWSVRKTPESQPFDVYDRSVWQQRFRSRITDFAPTTILDGKRDRIQLEFVDAGLDSWTRNVTSTSLRVLLEELISSSIAKLPPQHRHKEAARNDVLRLIFNLFACRALEDRGVINRADTPERALDSAHVRFSENITPEVLRSPFIRPQLADDVFGNLRRRFSFATLTTDILSDSYEYALVTKESKHALGIYYTPKSLTDYILRRLPIELIPQQDRYLWDPCCGSGSFLLAGVERLAELLPSSLSAKERHRYLRERIIGSDKDAFATEIASLALVLTDVDNENGWTVKQLDVTSVTKADLGISPTIVVTNLPFLEIKEGKGVRRELSAEILDRLIELSPSNSLLGIVMPQSFLDSTTAASVRRKVLSACEILEIALLPGALFRSATDTAVLLLRKSPAGERLSVTTVRELRSIDFQKFVRAGAFTRTYPISANRWHDDPQTAFHVSPLADLWERLEKQCARLGQVARVKSGLRVRQDDTTSVSEKRRAGDQPFIDRLNVLRPFALLANGGGAPRKWIRYSELLDRQREESIFHSPKVLINSTRNPGSAWRIVAAVSRDKLFFSENFNAVIPTVDVTLEEIAAVLNSPVANAWFDANCRKRKIILATLEKLPFPEFDEQTRRVVVKAVQGMEQAVREKWKKEAEGMFYDGEIETSDTVEQLAEIDRLVFDAYGLSPLERRHIMNLMSTDKRPS
jgi:hypothetical protein